MVFIEYAYGFFGVENVLFQFEAIHFIRGFCVVRPVVYHRCTAVL
jgi:hypothetical protein